MQVSAHQANVTKVAQLGVQVETYTKEIADLKERLQGSQTRLDAMVSAQEMSIGKVC